MEAGTQHNCWVWPFMSPELSNTPGDTGVIRQRQRALVLHRGSFSTLGSRSSCATPGACILVRRNCGKIPLYILLIIKHQLSIIIKIPIVSARIVSPLSHFFDNPKLARCRSPVFNGFSILVWRWGELNWVPR